MKAWEKLVRKIVRRITDAGMGGEYKIEELKDSNRKVVVPGMPEIVRQAAAEGCVLLKNKDAVLPLDPQRETAVFGRGAIDWMYVGYGSGGDVKAPYKVNLTEGLLNAGVKLNEKVLNAYKDWTSKEENAPDPGFWAHWPYRYEEMPLGDLAKKAATTSDTALVVLGRAAGEAFDNKLVKGCYYLADEERELLDTVTAAFKKVVVILNTGNIIDLSWIGDYGDKISGVLLVWQGGMESGNAVADVLTGKVCPCGRLADTIAMRYEDYPSSSNFGGKEFNNYREGLYNGYRYFDLHKEKVLYPFGFGLSYTEFKIEPECFTYNGQQVEARVKVTNCGNYKGKESVLLWCHVPKGILEKPERVLAAFNKTKALEPGESEELVLKADQRWFSSYSERQASFLLEKGKYVFKANDTEAGVFELERDLVIEKCEPFAQKSEDLKKRILERLPEELKGKVTPVFSEVLAGRASVESFVAGLDEKELEALTRGHGMMNSPLGTLGNAGAYGGITESLQKKGVPAVITADGPAGLRIKRYCTLIPCGTALACTFNTELVEQLAQKIGEEMKYFEIDVILAPGLNLHRDPLCGRNFEYYSEDPVLSGKMAAAYVRGVQSTGRAACPKHFACNNQETRRNTNDSRVSERALRELYLRNFEIVVREADPMVIMTSYNKINGIWSHYNYDLVTTVLRKQWGYKGCVITDWWMQKSASPEFPSLKNNAYRVRAQVDVLMPGDTSFRAKEYKADKSLLETLGKPEGITKAELQRTAVNVLKMAVRVKTGENSWR